ncbi:MAG TPA: PQQ-dependent sugar dehydrogenase [Burkholderiales bacterium]|nr:PQQ-dependent sugar dehydrogenase [Burkholderiales bacterium]
MFIAERTGQILVIDSNGALVSTPFLDISSRVLPLQGEGGLLSFTFDPNFLSNGFVYVHWTDNSITPTGDIVVERYQVSGTNHDVLQTPGVEIIRIPHPDATNHYGGRVMFGPDGMLYLSTGDGGGGNNQFGHAQDPGSLLGKILRLDVASLPYSIPADNPVWPVVGRNEVWAIGLRNPFRPAFDVLSNRLYIADVGQGLFEEVDVVGTTDPATAAGRNYGWSIMEGSHCFGASTCNMTGLTLPVYDYDHNSGECAVIGGFVYRGSAIPGLQGTYLFSDLCLGFLRGLTLDASGSATVVQAPMANAGSGVTQSFGRDGAGELYILTGDGRVLKIVGP